MSKLRRILQDPRALYYYFQKAVRSFPLRRLMGRLVAMALPKAKAGAPENYFTSLEREGFCYTEGLVSPKQVAEIRDYLSRLGCRDVGNPSAPLFRAPDEVPGSCRIGRFDEAALLDCPHLLSIANDPRVLATIERLFGCKPTITVFEAWWSFAGRPQPKEGRAYQDQMFHRDVEDFRFAKLFLYLTDVDDESGPHVFVRGSQNSDLLLERRPLQDDEVERTFGKDKILVYRGGSGTSFIEDTFGVHRGTPPRTKHRLIFSATYSLTGLNPQSPRKPLGKVRADLDPYVNRVYLG